MDEEQLFEQILSQAVNLISSGQQIPEDISQFLIQELQTRIADLTPTRIPQGAQLLWMLANGNEDAFRQYINNFPDPSLEQLRTNPRRLQRIVQDFQGEYPPQQQQAPDGFPQAGLQSSNVFGSLYDPKHRKLFVKFQGSKDYGQGSTYVYDNVPPSVARLMEMGQGIAKTTGQNKWGSWWKGKIPSLGAALNQLIKKANFAYQKLA